MTWNDERVDVLKKLWADGLSASQIAGRLGGVTRNAVIGKVHRLGLSGRATTSRMKSHRPRVRAQTAKQRHYLRLRCDVECRSGLVGNQQRGLRHQSHGDHHALALATRELVRVLPDPAIGIIEPDATQRIERPSPCIALAGETVGGKHLDELRAYGHVRRQGVHRVLKNSRDSGTTDPIQRVRIRADELVAGKARRTDRAAIRGEQSQAGEKGLRLSRTRFPDDCEALPRGDRERDLVHHALRALRGREVHAEAVECKQISGRGHLRSIADRAHRGARRRENSA